MGSVVALSIVRWKLVVVAVSAAALFAVFAGAAPALAAPPVAPPKPDPGPAASGVKRVPTHFVKPADQAAASYRATAVTFPAAVHASISLAGSSGPAVRSHAAGTPVWAQPVVDPRHPTVPGSGPLDVQILDRAATVAAGVDGVLLTISPSAGSGPVRVGIDYAAFAQAYGGDFGARLRLEQLPACALTTPSVPACRQRTPLASTNDAAAKTVSTQVTLGGSRTGSATKDTTTAAPMVLAATSDPGQEGGAGGSYAATTLKPSGSWTAGGSTGSFAYRYPVSLPPAPSSLVPDVGLGYDSSAVDGETATTQAQSSWVGDGWSTPASFVEQSFVSCTDNPEGTASPVATQDACYDGPILTLSLNGSSTSLVWDASKSVWKPQADNGDVVTHVTNSANGSGTYNTDYWTVTDRSGTVYQFGRNELPGWASGKPTTNAVDSEPVYSAHSGDPCYNAAGFTSSVCTMAYRWNLDYVKDVHGNAEAFYYHQDTNFYAQDKGAKMTGYIRDSHLDHIDYGFADGNAYATVPDKVVFATGDRCVSGTCDPLNSANAPNWPDVPFDLVCAQGATCLAQGPSFFSTVRLTSVAAQQYSVASSSYVTVDSYALSQSLPSVTGDGTSPTLWLDSVTHTASGTTGGGSTTPVTLPSVTFGKIQLQNRVDTVTDGLPPYYRFRIASITTETGSVISPTYQLVNPCTAPVTITPSANTSSCYPVYWTPPGYTAPFLDWFNKYAVTKVTATDPTGGAPATSTSYVYNGGAAWHYDDNEVVQAKYRTYGQFRGYGDVQTLTGDGANDPQTLAESTYYRGMSDDNNTTAVTLTDSAGGHHDDTNALAGDVLESTSYLGSGGPVDHSTITSYWVSAATATRNRTGLSALTANWVAPAETYNRQALTDGGTTTWRYTEIDNAYDATPGDATVGLVQHSYTHTVPANAAFDRCTSTTYAPVNGSANIVGPTAEVETDSVACGGFTEGSPASVPAGANTLTTPATVNRPVQVVSDARTFYDDPTFTTTFPQTSAPTKGDATMVRRATTWASGAFSFQTTARRGYDALGRVVTSFDGNGNKTSTSYTTDASGLVTGATVTNPLNQNLTTTFDPQRGVSRTVTDANGIVTTSQYDTVGRITSVWLYSRATTVPANYTYSYQVSQTGVTAVTTNRLTDQSAYRTSVQIYDGQLRLRQTQTNTPMSGRMVSDVFYDSRGWARAKYTNWWDSTTLPTVGSPVTASGIIPDQDFYTYDGLGRTVVDTSEDSGVVKSTTTTVYNGDRTTTIPPTGGVAQATVTDPFGRTIEADQYTTAPTVNTPSNTFRGIWSVSGGTSVRSTYGFDGHGYPNTVTDAQNNTWTSTYNLLGQVVAKSDPDAGSSTMAYDADGNPTQVTDSRGKTVSTTYDALNRTTGRYAAPTSGQSSANQIAAYVYDNANNVAGVTDPVGHLTTETAYWNGAAYTEQFKGFNVFGESLGETVTIPSGEGVLAGSYAFSHIYTSTNGLLLKDIYPAAGGLPAETVLHSYTAEDLPNAIGSGYGYKTTYDAWSRVNQETVGSSPSLANVTDSYDRHTGQPTDELVTRQVATPANVDDEAYRYDPAGNLTRQISTRSGALSPTETQCFTYDGLDRLAAAWTATDDCSAVPTPASHGTVGDSLGTTSAYWTTWSFDAIGQRTGQVQHSTTGGTDTTTAYTYNGNGTGQPHTLTGTALSGGASGSTTYGYDATGNTTSRNAGRGTQTLTWNALGQLTTVVSSTLGTSSFEYSADGNLLLQKDPGTTTLYLPHEQLVLNIATGTTTGTRYYPLPGGVTVVRTGTATGAYQFAIADRHGTPALYLDSTAQNPTWRLTTPYGDTRGGTATWPDNHGFLDKPVNGTTGLVEVGDRDYDPTLGRFVSMDPVFDPTRPQSWNGYTYADDNPVGRSDPSGNEWTPDPGGGPDASGFDPDPGNLPEPGTYTPSITKNPDGSETIEDQNGVPHTTRVGSGGMKQGEPEGLKYLNDQAKANGDYTDGSGTGVQYVAQDEDDQPLDGTGRTADFLELTFRDGQLVRVRTVDLYQPEANTPVSTMQAMVDRKLGRGSKPKQADVVVIRIKGPQGQLAEANARFGYEDDLRVVRYDQWNFPDFDSQPKFRMPAATPPQAPSTSVPDDTDPAPPPAIPPGSKTAGGSATDGEEDPGAGVGCYPAAFGVVTGCGVGGYRGGIGGGDEDDPDDLGDWWGWLIPW